MINSNLIKKKMLDDTIRKGQNKEIDNDMNLLKDKL